MAKPYVSRRSLKRPNGDEEAECERNIKDSESVGFPDSFETEQHSLSVIKTSVLTVPLPITAAFKTVPSSSQLQSSQSQEPQYDELQADELKDIQASIALECKESDCQIIIKTTSQVLQPPFSPAKSVTSSASATQSPVGNKTTSQVFQPPYSLRNLLVFFIQYLPAILIFWTLFINTFAPVSCW